MTFSQRKGYKKVNNEIQRYEISDELRIALWNVLDMLIWREGSFLDNRLGGGMSEFSYQLWMKYLKQPVDEIPYGKQEQLDLIRNYFFKCEWYEVYDFLEWIAQSEWGTKEYINTINEALAAELSGYRIIDEKISDIVNDEEIASIEEAINLSEPEGVGAHLSRSLEMYSDRKSPDYRNSIKESISAVESMARFITKDKKATLGDALKKIDKQGGLHKSLTEGFLKLYGYTSDEEGVRHAMESFPDLGADEAKYFIVACSAFVNYMKSKYSQS